MAHQKSPNEFWQGIDFTIETLASELFSKCATIEDLSNAGALFARLMENYYPNNFGKIELKSRVREKYRLQRDLLKEWSAT